MFFSAIIFGFKIFLFWNVLFLLGHIGFIFFLQNFDEIFTAKDFLNAVYYGVRLSTQTAGIFTLIILCATLFKFLKRFLAAILIFSTILLSFVSIDFFKTFHQNFNQMIFAGFHDDFFALLITFLQEFYLIPKLCAVIFLSIIAWKIFNKIQFNHVQTKKFQKIVIVCLAIFLINFTFYGGSLSWETELNFENIGVTKNNLLNESILDSFQAVHRAFVLQNRIVNSQGLNFSAENIKALTNNAENIDEFLKKSAQGAKIKKPKQIFLIVGESLPNWILLEKFAELHLADNLKIFAKNGAYCETFLPNGGSTISAVTGIVTGFADANLYLSTIPESYAEIFPTSCAPQMKKLNYTTNFFYSGKATWENIFEFTKAQGFDNFFCEVDIKNKFSDASGNVWGVDDKFLYQLVEQNLDFTQNNFSIILNSSNHAPYTVDLKSENIFTDDVKIGHLIYAEKILCEFIKKIQAREPESLFIIVGDHADRFNVDKNPSNYERFCVPLIIFGCGVQQNFFDKNCAGSQIDIVPTIIEIIAPKDFEYYSVGKSLTENKIGVNYQFFITKNFIGSANNFPLEPEKISSENAEIDLFEIENCINFVRGISYWRVKHGKNF